MSSLRVGALVAALSLLLTAASASAAPRAKHHAKARATQNPVTIKVLSGRADLVSGGSALVAIGGITSTSGLKVTAAGKDQTAAFGTGPDGKVQGLVTNLPLGD